MKVKCEACGGRLKVVKSAVLTELGGGYGPRGGSLPWVVAWPDGYCFRGASSVNPKTTMCFL